MLKSSLTDALSAYRNSKQFSAFLNGVDVTLPDGKRVRLQISEITPIRNVKLLQLYPYSYGTRIEAEGVSEAGYAEAHHPLLAIQKSISEAVERCLFRLLIGTPHGTTTSNGWSAHLSLEKARSAALFELLERDAILVHSLKEIPFLTIQPESHPAWLRAWVKRELRHTEFSELRILVSTHGHIPSISTVILDRAGYGVISHAADADLNRALNRALAETCRIARMALSGLFRQSSSELFLDTVASAAPGPCEQAVAYAHHHPFPDWMFGRSLSWSEARALWSQRMSQFQAHPIQYDFVPILSAPIAAGFCRSSEVQNLFFGRTVDAELRGDLNLKRLEKMNVGRGFSTLPHFAA